MRLLLLTVGMALAAPASPPADTAQVQRLFGDAHARGAAVVTDVRTGKVVLSVGVGRDVAAPVLPLSVIKLYVAAVWWERKLGPGSFALPRGARATVHELLVNGMDRPGAEMAIELRRRFGGEAVLAALREKGLGAPPGTLTLPPDADDVTWGRVLSIGEQHVTVTFDGVSQFLRTIATGSGDASRRLQAAMRETVGRGTAHGVAARLAGTGWQLGGKTGSGPTTVGPDCDGWFAGLAFQRGRPRYTIAVYVDRRGPGGGVAATIAAELVRALAGG